MRRIAVSLAANLQRKIWPIALCLAAPPVAFLVAASASTCSAAVAVISNRTPDDFSLTISIKGDQSGRGKPIERKLSAGDLTVFEMAHSDSATISATPRGGQPKIYE